MSKENSIKIRPIKSFVRRQGNISANQIQAFQTLWPQYGLSIEAGLIDPAATFGRAAPTILEIGFGNGQSLLTMAQADPLSNFIGIEVHHPGVGSLLLAMKREQINNIRIYQHDAIEVLQQCIPDTSLDRLQLYFPDPWPKNRHHKRRIVQPQFIELISQKLKTGGIFHCATDWQPYAEHVLEVMAGAPQFANLAAPDSFSGRPDYRPQTKYEQRGLKLGHQVYDLVFQKININ